MPTTSLTVAERIIARATIPGDPARKERPRFRVMTTKAGKNVVTTYTPPETRQAEEWIARHFQSDNPGFPTVQKNELGMMLRFYCSSRSQKKKDFDNLAKLVADALNGIAYRDDSQLVEVGIRIFRRAPNPRTELCLYLAIPYSPQFDL